MWIANLEGTRRVRFLKSRWLLVVAACLLHGLGAAAAGTTPAMEPIVLRAGESKVVILPDVSRVAIGQASVADVRVLSPGEVLVNGKSEGQTTLLFWPPSGGVVERPVRVLCAPPALNEQDVRDLVADDHVRVRTVAGYLVVDGHPSPQSQGRLVRLRELLGSRLLDLTVRESPEAAPSGLAQAPSAPDAVLPPSETDLESVARLIRASGTGLSSVNLSFQAGRVVLEGKVGAGAPRETAVRIAEAFFPGRVVDATQAVGMNGVFSIQARIIEVDRQASRELGVEWPADFGIGERLPAAGIRLAPLGRLEPLLVHLKALEDSGRARILAEPSMAVVDGSEGCFLAGGQIPVPLEVNGQITVEWKEYGVRLTVKPVLQATGRIRLSVRPEVSTLDWANGIRLGSGTVPALRSRWAETAVEQEDGDTLILAGLSLAEENDHNGSLPALSEIPLVGALFRSKRAARRQTDLTILVTTTLTPLDQLHKEDAQDAGPEQGD